MCLRSFSLIMKCQLFFFITIAIFNLVKVSLTNDLHKSLQNNKIIYTPKVFGFTSESEDKNENDDEDDYRDYQEINLNLTASDYIYDSNEEDIPEQSNRPIVDESGAVVLNSQDPKASRNASYMIPLYGNTSSYSGFVVANKHHGIHLFFVFHVSEKNPEEAPLVVWLQGQPTMSSLVGYFHEHGPYVFESDQIIQGRPFAWNREFNVLYLDYCAPCGYSYIERKTNFIRTSKIFADIIYNGLLEFFAVFEEFRKNSLYLAGEYICGNIIPSLISTIHLKNLNTDYPINLKGGMIGNAAVNSDLMVNYGGFWYQWGLLDPREKIRFNVFEHLIEGFIKSHMHDEVKSYLTHHLFVELNKRGYNTLYDIRELNEIITITNRNQILLKLLSEWMHVGNRTFYKNENLILMNMLYDLSYLIPDVLQNYKLLYYNGQFEMLFPYHQTSVYLRSIRWENINKWYEKDRYNWYIDNQLVGYVKHLHNLTHVLVRNAGHMVGKTEPKTLFYLLKFFIEDRFRNESKRTMR